ncbi:MAG TPA: hypothetical protein DDW28_04170, partial [Prevotella sp.]|nr:hypothetical protein [Candidatus Segatella violae]
MKQKTTKKNHIYTITLFFVAEGGMYPLAKIHFSTDKHYPKKTTFFLLLDLFNAKRNITSNRGRPLIKGR